MCVNQVAMVPAVVNFVASKGKDTYSGFISEFTCFKCRGFSVRRTILPRFLASRIRLRTSHLANGFSDLRHDFCITIVFSTCGWKINEKVTRELTQFLVVVSK